MSYILDSSAIFLAIKENAIETLAGNYTLELARYELGNVLWKEHVLRKRITAGELDKLIELVKRVLDTMNMLRIECQEKDILKVARGVKATFYDASYIFYAKEVGVSLITEDSMLIEKAKHLVKVMRIGDIL